MIYVTIVSIILYIMMAILAVAIYKNVEDGYNNIQTPTFYETDIFIEQSDIYLMVGCMWPIFLLVALCCLWYKVSKKIVIKLKKYFIR